VGTKVSSDQSARAWPKVQILDLPPLRRFQFPTEDTGTLRLLCSRGMLIDLQTPLLREENNVLSVFGKIE
jgi:hypothetical protein